MNGYIYVADTNNDRIQKFPPNSTSTTAGTSVVGGVGSGKIFKPRGVFVDGNGYIYVADTSYDRIQKFPPNSTSITNGTTVAGGSEGSGATQLKSPSGVYVDGSGTIFVADTDNHRIQKFPPNSTSTTNGITVAGTGIGGAAIAQLSFPSGVFVNASGIYVADKRSHRVRVFPPNSTAGTHGATVAGTGSSGSGATELILPGGVFVFGGSLYVADNGNDRVQKFALPGAPTPTATLTSSNPDCNGVVSATATVTDGTGPFSYSWVAPAGVSLSAASTSVVQASIGAEVTGVRTLTVTVRDAASQTTTATVSLNFNPPPTVTIRASSDDLGCSVTEVTLTAVFAATGTTYRWDDGTTLATRVVSVSGTYSVTATNDCSTTATTTIGFWDNCTLVRGQIVGTTVAGTTDVLGSGATKLAYPWGLYVDGSGIYVADQSNHRIQKFPLNSTSLTNGITVAGTGSQGLGETTLINPAGVYIYNGSLYVADKYNHRIQKFPPNSTLGDAATTVAGGNGGGVGGAGAAGLTFPSGVFVDASGIYVADYYNHRIQKFPLNSTQGTSGSTVAGITSTTGTGLRSCIIPPVFLWTRAVTSMWPTSITTGF